MSVLIKGMEMPKCCDDCLISCEHSMLYVGYKNTRSVNCPLVEIKTPHGYLIDKNELIEWVFRARVDTRERIAQLILSRPTIIERED